VRVMLPKPECRLRANKERARRPSPLVALPQKREPVTALPYLVALREPGHGPSGRLGRSPREVVDRAGVAALERGLFRIEPIG
jgi:hypothetical protein